MLQKVGVFEPASKDELLGKIENLRQLMENAGIDYALIIQNVDCFYFSGTMQKGMLVIPLDQDL